MSSVLFSQQFEELPETTIGIAYAGSRKIVLNKSYIKTQSVKYYISMLEGAAKNGYDCVLKLDGPDVIRELSKAM